MEYRMEHRDRVELQVRKRAVSTSSTVDEHDGLGTNMRLEVFVGFLHRPKFVSFRRVCAWCRAHGGDGYPKSDGRVGSGIDVASPWGASAMTRDWDSEVGKVRRAGAKSVQGRLVRGRECYS